MTSLARPALLGLALGFVGASLNACGSTKPCGPDTCQGCCDNGACLAGTATSACGSAGSTCVACDGQRTCTAGFCSGANGGGSDGGGSGGGGAGGGGGSSTGGGGGGLPSNPVDTFLTQLADGYCARSIACGFAASDATADCRALIHLSFGDVPRSAALQGTSLDQASAASCLSGVSAASCDALSRQMSLCLDALRATAVTGNACASGVDCASPGDRCAGQAWCSRTCRPMGTLGGPCRSTACNHGLYCDRATNTCQATVPAGAQCPSSTMCDGDSFCSAGKCVALPVAGQVCRSVTPRCAESAFCVGLTCQTRRPAGSLCATVDECEVGLACINAQCTARVGEGASCSASAECADGLACDAVLQRCQAVDYTIHRGGECTRSTRYCQVDAQLCAGQGRAADGGFTSSGTCRDTQQGDACANHFDCNAGQYCLPRAGNTLGACTPAGALTACSSAANCRAQDDCVNGLCQPRIATGTRCTAAGPGCADPAAVCAGASDVDATLQCRRLAPPGATCRSNTGACQFPAVCEDGGCVVAGHPGGPCLAVFGCLDGVCLAPDGGLGSTPTGRCFPPRADGEPCAAAPACTGTCDQATGVCVSACQ